MTRSRYTFVAVLVIVTSALLARAADAPATADPELERRSFKVADGFEVTLFAAEPMVVNPIGINFDAQGRLWVASSLTYPQVKPGDVPNDKIYVLEDTDGDGKADKSTVFADKLFIPTGVEVGDGGAYVSNSTELIHLADTDGDGKADKRRVVLSGFGTEDTHHIIHQFRWDMGGRLNFIQGIYIGSRVETPHGTRINLASGVWRLRPRTVELDVFATGLINPWGICWDDWGQTFLTDGAGGEGINFAPPGAAFTATPGAERVLKGLNPKSPKYCGVEFISGRHFPEEWRGSLITNDFRANRIVRFKLADDGAGFTSTLAGDVIVSTDKSFRPVDVKMGPDGALYIADWYDPIINHGEVDFRDPRRDKVHGRIWRIAAKGKPGLERPKLVGATVPELLELLLSPEQWTRQQVKWVLREKFPAEEVLPQLGRWAKALDRKGLPPAEAEHAKVEALWTYQYLNRPEPALLETLLKSPDPRARAAAVRVAGDWGRQLDGAARLIAPLVTDEHPRVRMEAVRAAAALGTPEAVPLAMRALEKPVEPLIDYALYKTAADLKEVWLAAFKAGKLSTWGDTNQLNFALKAVKSPDALASMVDQVRDGKVPPEARRDVYELLASIGGSAEATVLMQEAIGQKDPASKLAAVLALETAAKRKITPTALSREQVETMYTHADPALASAAVRLAGLYAQPGSIAGIQKLVAGPTTHPQVRIAAAEALAQLGRPTEGGADAIAARRAAAQKFLATHTDPSHSPAVRIAAIAGLASLDPEAAAPHAAVLLASANAETDLGTVLAAFLRRQGGVDALSAALKDRKPTPDVAKLAMRYIQGIGQDAGQLTQTLREASGMTGGAVALTAEQLQQLVADVQSKGDPARGEKVFRSAAAGCYQCHAIGGAGGPLGPDLRAIGASSPVDYIAESILDPNKAVKDGYAAVQVATNDGDLVHGILVSEAADKLVLRDNLRDEIAIPATNIRSRKPGATLMPAGLADAMTRAELLDLVRFLSELGKPGAYAVPNEPVMRRWRVIAANGIELPAYSLANGTLPADAMTPASPTEPARIYGEIEVTQAGEFALAVNSAKGLKVSINGKPATLDQTVAHAELPRGVHKIAFEIDPAQRGGEGLSLTVAPRPGQKGQAHTVGGR